MVIELPDILIDRYLLEETVGYGGMGTVVKAHDRVLERTVAVKVLRREFSFNPDMVERFRREARIAAALSHPGIAQVYDFAQEQGHSFIVMEFLDGEDLHSLITRDDVLDPASAGAIVAEAGEALEFAHASGAVHRDVKPANIFLTRSGRVKVTDFGIARAAGQAAVTTTGEVIGTTIYLSPEQANGMPATPASDIYSLGCVLFYLLTGRPPFEAESQVAVAMAHVSHAAPSVRDIDPNVPEEIDAIVARALSKEPEKRFATAVEMAEALRAAAGGGKVPRGRAKSSAGGGSAATAAASHRGPRTGLWTEEASPTSGTSGPRTRPARALRRPVVAVILMAALLLALVTISQVAFVGEPRRIPNWQGVPLEKARAEAAELGLAVEELGEPSDRQAGSVIRQEPPPGTEFKEGGVVKLVWSTGRPMAAVPNVTAIRLGKALEDLRALGFKFSIEGSSEEDAMVTAQDPPPGSLVAPGSTVELTAAEDKRGRGKGGDD